MTITPAPPLPSRASPSTFPARADAYVDWQANDLAPGINAAVDLLGPLAAGAAGAANIIAAANYKGTWASLGTSAVTIPASCYHNGKFWTLTANLANASLDQPGVTAGSKWVEVSLLAVGRSARTANAALTTTDRGAFIEITANSFTQTLAAATTLGAGWYCYLYNSGSGDITLDPNASEEIDGLTSYVVYPGEARLIVCTGTAFETLVVRPFVKTFTASGSFVKPPGYAAFGYDLLGGGGGGGSGGTGPAGYLRGGGTGGGGGARSVGTVLESRLGATTGVSIGAGGAGGAARTTNPAAGSAGTSGGTTTFGTFYANGGSGGSNGLSNPSFDSSSTNGGQGGGLLTGANPQWGGSTETTQGLGGGKGGSSSAAAGSSVYGGAGGGQSYTYIYGAGSLHGGAGGGAGGTILVANTVGSGGGNGGSPVNASGGGVGGTTNLAAVGGAGGNATADRAGGGGGGASGNGNGGGGGNGGVGGGGGGGGGGTINSGAGGNGGRGEATIWGI